MAEQDESLRGDALDGIAEAVDQNRDVRGRGLAEATATTGERGQVQTDFRIDWAISRVKCNKRSGVVIENFRHDFVRGLGIQRQARAPVHQSGNIVQAGLADG